MAARAELLFLDTSIQIARLLHGPAQRERVQARAKPYLRSSGLVCRQEFKRRVLKTAQYLLDVLTTKDGYENTHAYMTRLIQNPYHKRRATICLHLLAQATGVNDRDKTERLRVKLRTLLLTGLRQFDGWLDAPPAASRCGCGRADVRERPQGRKKVLELGSDECRKLPAGACDVEAFLAECARERAAILSYLSEIPNEKKTAELMAAEAFLRAVDADPHCARSQNPCLKVGDLMIALESAAVGAKAFYTMNGKESQHLCRPLGQTLIVRPPDPAKDDILCDRAETAKWPEFGQKPPQQ